LPVHSGVRNGSAKRKPASTDVIASPSSNSRSYASTFIVDNPRKPTIRLLVVPIYVRISSIAPLSTICQQALISATAYLRLHHLRIFSATSNHHHGLVQLKSDRQLRRQEDTRRRIRVTITIKSETVLRSTRRLFRMPRQEQRFG
jgi:hypothetical protein